MAIPTPGPDRLANRILWGMAVGVVAGVAARLVAAGSPTAAAVAAWTATEVLDPIGQIFLRLLFFVVIPLIFASLTLGVLQLGRLDRLGPLAGRTFALFAVNMVVGVAIGLLIMNTIRPGARLSLETRDRLVAQSQTQARDLQVRAAEQPRLSLRFLVEMFMPRNLLKAAVDFQILPVILFALLVGAAGTRLSDDYRRQARDALDIIGKVMTDLVHLAMQLAPYAVAALLAAVVIRTGFEMLQALLLFVGCALAGMGLHLFGTLPLLLRLLSRRRPGEFFRTIRVILVTALSTSSSNATLPTSLLVTERQLGVSPGVAGFVLPLGATMNMSGTALYEGCVVLFVAQVYGVSLGLASQLTLLVMTVLSAVAVAGIPGASLPLIVGLLAAFHIPPEGIALILGVDRLLDMARTVLNVAADVVTACIVDEATPAPQPTGPTATGPDP